MLWLFLRRLLLQSLLWLLWPLLLWLLLLLLFDYSFCSCTAVVATGVVVVSDSCCSYNGSNYGCCSSNYLLLRLSEICATHTAKIGTDGRPFEHVFWLTGCTSGQTSWTCAMSSIIGYYFIIIYSIRLTIIWNWMSDVFMHLFAYWLYTLVLLFRTSLHWMEIYVFPNMSHQPRKVGWGC